jgi:hypothetical protein
MPLWLLAVIVVVGLTGIWLAARALGFSRTLVLDEPSARREWAAQNPFDKAGTVRVSGNGKAALISTVKGPYLLWVMGLDSATHPLSGAGVEPTQGGLFISLHDFAAPGVRIALTPAEAAKWQGLIDKAA